MDKSTPIIICRLCDENGNELNIYRKDSIRFTELTSPQTRTKRRICLKSGKTGEVSAAKILIEGYVSASMDGQNLSAPIPFRIKQWIYIYAPDNAELRFTVNNLVCHAVFSQDRCADYIKILINIETAVSAVKQKEICACNDPCVVVDETTDTIRMLSHACIAQRVDQIKAETYQYTALSDGVKRVYTDADELKEYGHRGILSPHEVAYYNLYVNGVLQPKVNYRMTKGRLVFITADIPTEGATIIIKYITFKSEKCIDIKDDQYFTIADGVKREYTNADELKKYSTRGIPGPDEVSYYNLYFNGVLQPKRNYSVKKGLLRFLTADIPQKDHTIILESIAIQDGCGRLMDVEEYQFDTIAKDSRAYCPYAEITPYGKGILAPSQASYQNLMVNAVNQPRVDYKVCDSCLILRTEDLPTAGSPVTLQSIRILNDKCYGGPCNRSSRLCISDLMAGY